MGISGRMVGGSNSCSWETDRKCDFAGNGMQHEQQFQRYHRVLNRTMWSSRQASRLLLQQLVSVFAPRVLVMGMTRLSGAGQANCSKGIYRDPVRSSDSHLVKASGLRWLSLLLVPIPWALGITVSNSLSPFTTLP